MFIVLAWYGKVAGVSADNHNNSIYGNIAGFVFFRGIIFSCREWGES